MSLSIISADDRLGERKGPKILLLAVHGTGKTHLFRTMRDLDSSLFVDIEAGELSLAGVRGDHVRPKTWEELRDIACLVGGPNKAHTPNETYSQAHYDKLIADHNGSNPFEKYTSIFIDSISDAAPICFKWSSRQEENITKAGKVDKRGAYGDLGLELLAWLRQFQHARSKTVIFAAKLDRKTDDFNREFWDPQIMGSATKDALPGIVDHVFTLAFIDEDLASSDNIAISSDGQYRAFVTKAGNPFGYPAKVRDPFGNINRLEPADLGNIIAKLETSQNTARMENG